MAFPSLLRTSFGSYARYALSFLVSFLLIPFMLGKVGTEAFGLWSLLFSLLGFFGLLDSGMGVSVVKIVAETRGSQDIEGRNRTLSTIFSLYLGLSLVAFFVTFLAGFFISDLLAVPTTLYEQAFTLFWLLSLRAVVLHLPLSLFRGVLFGDQQTGVVNGISAVQNLLYGGLAWWLLSSGYGIVSVGLASLVAMLVEHLLYLLVSYRRVPSLHLSFQKVDWAELRPLFSFGRHQFITDVSSMVLLQMDLLLVRCFFTLDEVAIYAVALRLATHSYYLVKQFVNLLGPKVAELVGSGRDTGIRNLLIEGNRIALLVALPLWVGFLFLGAPFLHHWVGPSVDGAFLILSVLVTAMVFGVPAMIGSVALAMAGEHERTSRVALISVACNLVLSSLLALSMGLVGIALGTLLTRILVDYSGILRPLSHRWGLTLRDWARRSLAPLVPATLVQAVVLQLVALSWSASSLAEVMLQGVLSLVGYGAVAYPLLRENSFSRAATHSEISSGS